MKYTLRWFGIPVLSFEIEGDSEQFYLSNSGGSFDLEEGYEEEESDFGFRSR